jgi:hypothetical protein
MVTITSDKTTWRRHYHSNGQLHYEVPYVDGKYHGLERYWHSNGQLCSEQWYYHGQQINKPPNELARLVLYGAPQS